MSYPKIRLITLFLFSSTLLFVISSCATQNSGGVTSDKSSGNLALYASGTFFKTQPTEDDFARSRSFMASNLMPLVYNVPQQSSWVNDSTLVYRINTGEGPEFVRINISSNERTPLFDHHNFADVLRNTVNDTITRKNIPVQQFRVSDDLNLIYFSVDRRRWVYDIAQNELNVDAEEVRSPPNSVLSPDGNYAAFIRSNNLWVRDMQTGEDIQLTIDGEEYFGYATNSQGWTRSNNPILRWSDNSKKISTYRLDERGVEKMHLLETAEHRSKHHSWPYALPGDTIVPMHERLVIDVNSKKIIKLNTPPDHQRTSNCCGLTRGNQWTDNQFSEDASKLAFVSTSRDYATITLRIANTTTGDVRTVYSETQQPFIETNLTSRGEPNWRMLFDSNEFIWFSHHDDWGHLYLHDAADGALKNRITSGAWNVADIHQIDEQNRVIWFTAVGREPNRDVYQEYLYRVNFDGSDLRLLTPEEGHHSISFSSDGNFIFNSWSDYQTPPKSVIRDKNGEILMQLEEADISEVLALGWPMPEPFVVKGRDGETDVYGIMFKPSNFDPNKRYPIINGIYPGPQVGSINTPAFSVIRRGNAQSLAELGFIVVQIDAMGTPMRSKPFHTAYFGNMIDNGLPDQVAAMKQLAEMYPWIDINRAGIYGHSGGGFATAAAMFTFPEFFKVGVASAGNMDNRGYTYYWGEKYHGEKRALTDSTDTYTNQAIHLLADQLQGKLLISYGTMDSNVHPNMTELVIQELIRHDKDFDVMVFPNRGHGYFNEAYNVRITFEYFLRHL